MTRFVLGVLENVTAGLMLESATARRLDVLAALVVLGIVALCAWLIFRFTRRIPRGGSRKRAKTTRCESAKAAAKRSRR